MDTQSTAGRPTTVRDLVAVIFRQKWIILTVFTVTTLSVVMLNLRTPTTYESSGRIKVERGRKETPLVTNTRVMPWTEEMSSEVETVKSYPVSRTAQEILDAWYEEGEISRPIRLNRGGIGAGVVGESNVITVSYTSQDASICRPVTSAVIESYTRFRREVMTFPQVASFFERELDRIRNELHELEGERFGILAELGPGGSEEREVGVQSQLLETETDIYKLDEERVVLTQQLRQSRALLAEDDLEAAFFSQIQADNAWVLNQLRNQLIAARLTADELAATLTPEHPRRKQAESALASISESYRKEITSTVAMLESRLEEAEAQLASLHQHRGDLQAELTRMPQARMALQGIDARIELKQEELGNMAEKQLTTIVNLATSPDYTVTMISPASAPSPMRTKDYVRMGLAPLMSLVVGLLLAFFLDSLDHSLRSPHDVEEHLGLPVLASLPESRR